MNRYDELSEKSETFLENLRAYLFSSGKNEKEIDSIIDELEVHLYEAEQDGKPIEKIVGNSPKDYMKSVSEEMTADYRKWTVYIMLIIFGSIAIDVMPDLVNGSLSYSILKLVGHIVIVGILIGGIFTVYRYASTKMLSLKKQMYVAAPIVIVPMGLFVGLIYLDRAIDTPMIHFGVTGSVIIGIVMTMFIIGLSVWSRTWILIVVMALLTIPDMLLGLTSLEDAVQLIVSTWITFGGLMIYLWISNKVEKNKQEQSQH